MFTKWFKNQNCNENCISCALGLTLRFSGLMGLHRLYVNCTHAENRNVLIIYLSKHYMCTGIILSIFLIFTSICYFYTICTTYEKDNLIPITIDIAYFIYCIRTTITITMCVYHSPLLKDIFTSLQTNITNWKLTKSENLLPRETAAKIHRFSVLFRAFVVTFLLIYGINLFRTGSTSKLGTIKTISAICCFYLDFCISLFYSAVVDCFGAIVLQYQRKLKTHLNMKMKTGNSSVKESLILSRRLHSALFTEYKHCASFSDPATGFFYFFTIVMLILANFTVLSSIFYWVNEGMNALILENIGLDCQLYLSATTGIYTIYRFYRFARVVSN